MMTYAHEAAVTAGINQTGIKIMNPTAQEIAEFKALRSRWNALTAAEMIVEIRGESEPPILGPHHSQLKLDGIPAVITAPFHWWGPCDGQKVWIAIRDGVVTALLPVDADNNRPLETWKPEALAALAACGKSESRGAAPVWKIRGIRTLNSSPRHRKAEPGRLFF